MEGINWMTSSHMPRGAYIDANTVDTDILPTYYNCLNKNITSVTNIMDLEFESRKNQFQNFPTERKLLNSKEFYDFINYMEKVIDQQKLFFGDSNLSGGYISSYLVDLWRKHQQDQKDATGHYNYDPSLDRIKGATTGETFSWPSRDICCQYTKISRQLAIKSPIDQMNFRLVCQYADKNKIVEPDIELPAISCHIQSEDNPNQFPYSWELFRSKFEHLLNQEIPGKKIEFCQGTINYIHPDKTIRTIDNQDQFTIALNHFLGTLEGSTATFYFLAAREISPMKFSDEKEVVSTGSKANSLGLTPDQQKMKVSGWEKHKIKPSYRSKIPVSRKEMLKSYSPGKISKISRLKMKHKQKKSSIPRYSIVSAQLAKLGSDQSSLAPYSGPQKKEKIVSYPVEKYRISRKKLNSKKDAWMKPHNSI